MVKNIVSQLTNTFKNTSLLPNLSPQKNTQLGGFIWLLLIASLVIPPTAVAALSPNPVFFSVKAWGIEYQFQKKEIEHPQQK